jgi:nitrite reductase (NADH) small subunit
MMRWVKAARLEEVPPGTGRAVEIEGRPIALFNVEGTIHALDGLCPHQGGPLGEGTLSGNVVMCPWHFWEFDVVKGHAPDLPDAVIRKYPVTLRDGDILLEIE